VSERGERTNVTVPATIDLHRRTNVTVPATIDLHRRTNVTVPGGTLESHRRLMAHP
jgi:hypothetical protein